MKRLWLGIATLGVAVVLGGCPIYSNSGNFQVCDQTACWDCPDAFYSSACVPWQCGSSADCAAGYFCNVQGTCSAAASAYSPDAGLTPSGCTTSANCPAGSSCGTDGNCHTGECGDWGGCTAGYVCKVSNGQAHCAPITQPGYDAATTGNDSGPDGAGIGNVLADASDGSFDSSDGAGPTKACNADSQCGGSGAKCIDGQCTPQGQLCSDTSQCVVASEACVDGVCTPRCSANASTCPNGYACDIPRGFCGSVNQIACANSAQCQGGAICVETHCVSPCTLSDAGASCPTGQVCVNGGCIPDQRAQFSCKNDGETGALANICIGSDICLHGDCYPPCSLDAGACPGTSVCQEVTISKGTYAVCAASASTLGSDCDPATGNYCSGSAVCIDGYCK
jgi:predicted outer membrane repeat protein